MRPRVSWMLKLVIVIALVVASCGSDDDDPTPTQASGSGGSPTATAASGNGGSGGGDVPEDEIGVVEIAEGDPVTIAYALVVTGPDETLGIDSRRGIELAIADFGGEILGHPIELIGEDTGCTPEGGQAAASRIAANEQVVAVIGTSCSSEARVLAPVVGEAGLVTISPSNTAPDLTDPATRSPGYFRTAHNDIVQGAVVAEFAFNELSVTKVATIHDGSVYAEQLANVFAERIEELGGEVVAREAVGPTDTDMRPVLTRIAAQEPELIYYPIFTASGGFVTRQAREVSGLEDVHLMGSDGLFSADFIQAAGEAGIGMFLSSPDFGAFAGGYQDFLAKHEEAYGEAPLSAFHAHAYDATMIALNAIAEVAVEGEDGTLHIPRQALRDAVAATNGLQGLTGTLTCDENGDCADPKIAVYEIGSTDVSDWPDSVVSKVYPD